MKKREEQRGRLKTILLTIASVFFVLFVIIPLTFALFDGPQRGNVAKIPIEGPITGNGGNSFGDVAVSSSDVVEFIESADEDAQIKAILLEINSPGGSAVASDEIAAAIKKTEKPVVAVIREAGASGGYWIASAADHIIANRMSITGSIGVISSYLEFSGLMDKYGVGYQRLVAGDRKDIGVPLRKLDDEEQKILQGKLNRIHAFFMQGVAENRGMKMSDVEKIATGEFYLGVEALELGLVDQLGDEDTAEKYLKEKYDLETIEYVVYQKELGFLELLTGVVSDFFFNIGEGMASVFVKQTNQMWV